MNSHSPVMNLRMPRMPRGPRVDVEGALYHVIARGVERRAIFRYDSDRAGFVTRLSGLVEAEAVTLFAYVLLDNHFHLVLRREATALGQFMRRYQAVRAEDLAAVAARSGIPDKRLAGPGRAAAASAARRQLVRIAVYERGIRPVEVAHFLGITTASVAAHLRAIEVAGN